MSVDFYSSKRIGKKRSGPFNRDPKYCRKIDLFNLEVSSSDILRLNDLSGSSILWMANKKKDDQLNSVENQTPNLPGNESQGN